MKFPNRVYVYVDEDGDDEWLLAEKSVEDCAVQGEKRLVGVYDLVEQLTVSLEVKKEVVVTKEN